MDVSGWVAASMVAGFSWVGELVVSRDQWATARKATGVRSDGLRGRWRRRDGGEAGWGEVANCGWMLNGLGVITMIVVVVAAWVVIMLALIVRSVDGGNVFVVVIVGAPICATGAVGVAGAFIAWWRGVLSRVFVVVGTGVVFVVGALFLARVLNSTVILILLVAPSAGVFVVDGSGVFEAVD